MTKGHSTQNHIYRNTEWKKLEFQIRSHMDSLVISPPLTGLTSFLNQSVNQIKVSDAYENYTPIFFDRLNKVPDAISDLFTQIVSKLAPNIILSFREGERLQDGFLKLYSKTPALKTIVFIDDLQLLPNETIQVLFENIRGISESRLDYHQLNNVVFILAGHSINLRELDPRYISPFNTARIINIGDFSETEGETLISLLLPLDKFFYSKLIAKYIHFITSGQPYLISLICEHIKLSTTEYDKLDFEKIDLAVEQIKYDFRDPLIRQILISVKNLNEYELLTLRSILNGKKLTSSKTSPSLEKLELLGLISRQKNTSWIVRNHIIDQILRKQKSVHPVIEYSHIMQRRLFMNVEGYKMLYELENDLRDFVISKMFEKYGDIWIEKIGSGLIEKWYSIEKAEKEGNRFSKELYPILTFALFPDIYKVINGQWKQIFHKFFKPLKIFTGYFEALEILRNKIAHNRSLRDSELEQLEAITRRFRGCMQE